MNTSIVRAECPACKSSLRVPAEWLGRVVRCKQCAKKFKIAGGAAVDDRDSPAAPTAPTAPRNMAAPRPIVEPLPAPTSPKPPAPIVEPLPPETPHANGTVPAPVVPAQPDGYIPAFAAGGKYKNKGRYRPKAGSGLWKWALIVFMLLSTAGGFYATKRLWNKPEAGPVAEEGPAKPKPGSAAIRNATAGAFPRRMLAISVQNYLFANPLLDGDRFARAEVDRTDFAAVASKAASRWHVPDSQLYILSDGQVPKLVADPLGDGSMKGAKAKAAPPERAPMKEVIEKTIELFCDTSREQDRVVILIACHAIEKDGKAYLTPMEGDFDEVETLVPLDFVYEKIGKCKAQQKLVIFDVCRFDPVGGAERPTGGMMSEELAKALHSPPEGVSVWTSCSPGEYSYEYESASLMRDGRERYVSGSVFLFDVQQAASRGKLYADPKKGGLQAPAEPIPVDPLVAYVDKEVSGFVKDYEAKATQTPKFTAAPESKAVEYDPDAKLPARFPLPAAPEGAAKDEVAAIFAEVALPPIKLEKGGASIAKQAAGFPFRKEALEGYLSDGVTVEEIKKKPEKWPLRFAVVDAVEKARVVLEEKNGDDSLPEKYLNTASDMAKAQILRQQRIPTLRRDELRDLLDRLVAAAPKKEQEKSKRWLAHYDYVVGEFKMRIAYLEEFNLAYGKVRKDELPELDPTKGHKGWVLAASTKIAATKEIRDLADEGRDLLVEVAKENPHTPWALLAKRDKGIVLGLKWEPFSDGTPVEEKPAKEKE